jgi:hypothetical protein
VRRSRSCRIPTSGCAASSGRTFDAFDAFVHDRVVELVQAGDWDQVTFVAKSRGTLFLSTMAPLRRAVGIQAVWVTPLLGLDYVRAGVVEKGWRSLVVAGSRDPYHDAGAHAEVCDAIGATSLILDGADHGLVVRGDVRATVEGFARLAEESLAFANGPQG